MARLEFPETRRELDIPVKESKKSSVLTTLAVLVFVIALSVGIWFSMHKADNLATTPAGSAGHDYNNGAGVTGVGDFGSRP